MGHDLTYIMRVIMAHICKKCFLREMAEEDAKMIEKYKKGIKETDRVSEKKYEERLAVCKECDLSESPLLPMRFQ